jgi:hypothetical protein
METVRSGSLSSSHKADPSVYAVVTCTSVHAKNANVWRRDRSLFVQYRQRRSQSSLRPALAAQRGRRWWR